MDQGNTAFLLIAAALVLLMTPGLAFFYGGLVKAKSVISMMMMSFGAIGLIGVLWVLYGYAIAFPGAEGVIFPWSIDGTNFGLAAATADAAEPAGDYPTLAFVAFQATFAIITVALISGAIADRAKFGAWMLFSAVWATVVYFPVASWVFNFGLADDGTFAYGGWTTYGLQEALGVGVIDFAGGTAVHINAGAAALALALSSRQARRLRQGCVRAAQPAIRAARRGPPLVRLVRLQRGFGARRRRHRRTRVRQHDRRSRGGAARLARRRGDQGRQAHLRGCRVRSRGGARRHHPGLRRARPDLGHRARDRRGCGVRDRHRPEVRAGLRRLARRRRHPPRRRPHRNAVPRLLRQRHRACSWAATRPSCSCRRSPRSPC